MTELEQEAERRLENIQEDSGKSASTKLVELAMANYEFGVSTLGECFAIPKAGPKVVSMLRGSKTSLRNHLARLYYQKHRRAAPQQALADALLVVEGEAQQGEEQELYLRVAQRHDDLWLDLGDATGKAVRINEDGWTIEEPPMLFKRTALMGSLPIPQRGGSLDDLWGRLNVTVADRPLVAAWLVMALYHNLPHPVLSFLGEQGTGKSTASKIIVSLLDNGPVLARKPPRDAESWITAAAGSWLVALDNLSDIQPWLSDSICRAVTGDGDVRRRLYTDGDVAVFSFRRAVILNSIDFGASRGDLAERMLPIHLEVIPDKERLMENAIWPTWLESMPRVLGAVLDLAAGVAGIKHNNPSLRLATKPRMADYANILLAVDSILGTDGLRHYLDKQASLAMDSLDGDDFMGALIASRIDFEGTAAELLKRLTPNPAPKGWPKARKVTGLLKRGSPALRKLGWQIKSMERRHDKVTVWLITPPTEIMGNSSPQDPQHPHNNKNQQVKGEETAGNDAGNGSADTRTIPASQVVEINDYAGNAGNTGNESGQSTYDREQITL